MKPATKAEKTHMAAVVDLGCIACLNQGVDSPAGIHHVRYIDGVLRKRDHMKTIGLCQPHHQFYGAGLSVHDGRESWQLIHGLEQDLLGQVNELCRKMEA